MTFFFSRSPWSDQAGKSLSPGVGRCPSGDTRREEDAERPRQTGVLVRTPAAFVKCEGDIHAKSEPC
jgi:hypothetical protein